MNVAIAFGAGILSFLSPCVLPLVPAFLVNMAGEAALAGTQRGRTVVHALAFVVGGAAAGSVVFALSGCLVLYAVQTIVGLGAELRSPAPEPG